VSVLGDGMQTEPNTQATPNGQPPTTITGLSILEAPNYAKLIQRPQTAVATEYTRKVNSLLKSAVFGCLRMGDLPDAAAILHYGPDFSQAAGHLADQDERAKKVLDMVTAPGSPYVVFAEVAVALIAQLARNHQTELQELPQKRRDRRRARREAQQAGLVEANGGINIPLINKRIPVSFRFRTTLVKGLFNGFRSQTAQPTDLVHRVFQDEALRKALEKQGIRIGVISDES
jgi:hypothetical protein